MTIPLCSSSSLTTAGIAIAIFPMRFLPSLELLRLRARFSISESSRISRASLALVRYLERKPEAVGHESYAVPLNNNPAVRIAFVVPLLNEFNERGAQLFKFFKVAFAPFVFVHVFTSKTRITPRKILMSLHRSSKNRMRFPDVTELSAFWVPIFFTLNSRKIKRGSNVL